MSAVDVGDLGAQFYVAPRRTGGWIAWAMRPGVGLLYENGDTADGAVLALRARWILVGSS